MCVTLCSTFDEFSGAGIICHHRSHEIHIRNLIWKLWIASWWCVSVRVCVRERLPFRKRQRKCWQRSWMNSSNPHTNIRMYYVRVCCVCADVCAHENKSATTKLRLIPPIRFKDSIAYTLAHAMLCHAMPFRMKQELPKLAIYSAHISTKEECLSCYESIIYDYWIMNRYFAQKLALSHTHTAHTHSNKWHNFVYY